MLRQRIGLGAVGLSAIAAIASVALPAAFAQSNVRMTAKQASLLGLPAPAQAASEEMVGALIVKMRATGSQLAQAQGGAYVRSASNMAGVGVKAVRQISDSSSHVALEASDDPVGSAGCRCALGKRSDGGIRRAGCRDEAVRCAERTRFCIEAVESVSARKRLPGNVVVVGQPTTTTSAPATGAANLITAWDRTTGSDTVVVAVIDTGIVNHPDLNNAGLALRLRTCPGAAFSRAMTLFPQMLWVLA